jgi:ribonuclease HI
MEMLAIVEGLRALKGNCEVKIRTDSRIAMSWCEGRNFTKPRHRNALPEAYAMHLAFQELAKKHKVTFEWVKGHAGDPDNERADYLAAAACRAAGGQAALAPAMPVPTAISPSPAPVVAPPATPTPQLSRPIEATASPGMIRLTRDSLHALSGSPALNGFTRKQIELLGFTYPAPKGWLSSLIGKEIPTKTYEEAKKAIASKWKQRKDQDQMKL